MEGRVVTDQGDVKVFYGVTAQGIGEAHPPPTPKRWDPVPPWEAKAEPQMVPEMAVAVGGVAGNNAHGAGFLEALRQSGKKPQIISCTSGQLRCVHAFLQGWDITAWFKERLAQLQPCGDNADGNLLYRMTWGLMDGPIRVSLVEFPTDVAATVCQVWRDFWLGPGEFSVFRNAVRIWPARSLVCREEPGVYQEMAEAFNGQKDIGIIFNAYDFAKGTEIVHMNDRAFRLVGKQPNTRNDDRPWISYASIDADAVKNALRLYEYGCHDGSTILDGAYVRDIILSEIPDKNNGVTGIAVARPQANAWLGPSPLSWTEMRDLQTEITFNATYFGEREGIRLTNQLAERKQLKKNGGSHYRRIEIAELPLNRQRGWWDYILEDMDVFMSAYWRGSALIRTTFP